MTLEFAVTLKRVPLCSFISSNKSSGRECYIREQHEQTEPQEQTWRTWIEWRSITDDAERTKVLSNAEKDGKTKMDVQSTLRQMIEASLLPRQSCESAPYAKVAIPPSLSRLTTTAQLRSTSDALESLCILYRMNLHVCM